MHCAPCTPEKKIRVVENRCFQCAESIFVNLPQFAKSGLNESLHRILLVFFFTSFGYFGLVSSLFCFCECLFHCSTYDWKTAVNGGRRSTFASVNPAVFWRNGKEAVGCKF